MPLNLQLKNQKPPDMVLRARMVLPISGPPISNGAVAISGNRILSIGRWQDFSAGNLQPAIDLGDMILMPGLINAHCHLDYTSMAGELPPQKSFVDWIKLMMSSKAGMYYSHFAESWLNGAKMLLRTGTTTVADVELVPELLPEVWTATPLRVFSFLEMTGVKSRRPPAEIVGEALDKIATLHDARCRAGLSPHAPYSTTPELLQLSAEAAHDRNLLVTIHVAESREEFEMFSESRGKMYDWLSRSGRDMADCGVSPVKILDQQGLLAKNVLAVHVNYLAPGDAALLGKRHVNIVHCPRSHSYFRHRHFPFPELVTHGVNLCLGTDSLATTHGARKQTPELNMFDEMRELASHNPALKPKMILQMATTNGAAALGMKHQIGELTPGAFADLIAIPFTGKIGDGYDAAVHHRGNVAASMINGEWAMVGNELKNVRGKTRAH